MRCITWLLLSTFLPVSLAYSQQATPANGKVVSAPGAIPPPPDGSGIINAATAQPIPPPPPGFVVDAPSAPASPTPPLPSGYQLVIPVPEVLACETMGTCTPDVAKRGLWLYRFAYTDAIMNHGEVPDNAAKKAEDARELCEGFSALNFEMASGESQPDASPVQPGSGIENSRAAYVYGQTLTEEACTPGANGDTVTKDASIAEATYRSSNKEAWAKLQSEQKAHATQQVLDATTAKSLSNRTAQMPNKCTTSISFATVIDGRVVPESRNFESKWFQKNGKKFPGL